MSGSASPVTETQIENAVEAGFEEIRIRTDKIVQLSDAKTEKERVLTEATRALDRGDSVVIFTAKGPEDSAIERTEAAFDKATSSSVTRRIGNAQGEILRELVESADLARICVAGGDTSGRVAPRLGIKAIRSRYPLAPGSPVCQTLDSRSKDHLQIAFKGGQLGGPDYFLKILQGSA